MTEEIKESKDVSERDLHIQYQNLCKLIDYHDRLYYVELAPILSDEEYDKLYRELQDFEKKYPYLAKPDSPTKKVAGGYARGNVRHVSKMYSLENVFSEKELVDWFKSRVPVGETPLYYVDLKADGLAIELVIEDNKAIRAVRRGDGERGDDITDNFMYVVNNIDFAKLYSKNNNPQFFTVRGELTMSRKELDRLNSIRADLGEPLYSNARNAVAGLMIVKDLEDLGPSKPRLDFYSYEITDAKPYENELSISSVESVRRINESHNKQMAFLTSAGFDIILRSFKSTSLMDIFNHIQYIEDNRSDIAPFRIDGAVVKIDSIRLRERMGYTSKYPKWAVAYKFKEEAVETTIRDIELHIGRGGIVVPVALLDPIVIDGVRIVRATMHNFKHVRDKDIRRNDVVLVKRGGDVIPVIEGPVLSKRKADNQKFMVPTSCPFCNKGLVKEHVGPVCVNPECPARRVGYIKHFVSKHGLDIKGIGERIINMLVTQGLVNKPADLFKINKNQLLSFPGIQEKAATNYLNSIHRVKQYIPLDKFISSLGILHVGLTIARQLSKYYQTWEAFAKASEEDLLNIVGIGHDVAHSIVNYLRNPNNIHHIDELFELGVKPSPYIDIDHNGVFSNKKVAITGVFTNKSRSEIETIIKRNGGVVVAHLPADTDILVYGSKPGKRYQKAKEMGMECWDESTFFQHLK